MDSKLESVINEYVRPFLNSHGGDIEVLQYKDDIVRFKMIGNCAGCPSADYTNEEVVKSNIMQHIPEVKDVILVNEVSDSLMEQAREIMKQRQSKE